MSWSIRIVKKKLLLVYLQFDTTRRRRIVSVNFHHEQAWQGWTNKHENLNVQEYQDEL